MNNILENNKPLTWDNLLQMIGKRVWILELTTGIGYYTLITNIDATGMHMMTDNNTADYGSFALYEKTWVAYCCKPEEGI